MQRGIFMDEIRGLMFILSIGVLVALVFLIAFPPPIVTYEIIWYSPEGKVVFHTNYYPTVHNGECRLRVNGEIVRISGTYKVTEK